MNDVEAIGTAVLTAWSAVPAPPPDDVKNLAWSCGEDGWRTFVGIAPVAVDISSPGFLGCTPLLELPARAAAAYLGTYLLSFLDGLKFQEESVVFYDILTRAHLLSCLDDPDFWRDVVRPYLSAVCRRALNDFCALLFERRETIGLSADQASRIVELSLSMTE